MRIHSIMHASFETPGVIRRKAAEAEMFCTGLLYNGSAPIN